jgi:hypothetical protein
VLQTEVVLVDQTGTIQPHHLVHTAAAIQIQVNRDLAKFWPGANATVSALPASGTIPPTVWQVNVVKELPPGEGGYHWVDGKNQPFANILGGPGWTVTASHEICEMLVDPWGNRLQRGPQILLNGSTQSLGNMSESYLVEVCDPCEAHGYTILDVPVSDFITPEFYQTGVSGGRYSYTGNIKAPLSVLPGGYISWMTDQGQMMQLLWVDPGQPPRIENLGSAAGSGKASLKDFVDSKTGSTQLLSSSNSHPAVLKALAAGFVP